MSVYLKACFDALKVADIQRHLVLRIPPALVLGTLAAYGVQKITAFRQSYFFTASLCVAFSFISYIALIALNKMNMRDLTQSIIFNLTGKIEEKRWAYPEITLGVIRYLAIPLDRLDEESQVEIWLSLIEGCCQADNNNSIKWFKNLGLPFNSAIYNKLVYERPEFFLYPFEGTGQAKFSKQLEAAGWQDSFELDIPNQKSIWDWACKESSKSLEYVSKTLRLKPEDSLNNQEKKVRFLETILLADEVNNPPIELDISEIVKKFKILKEAGLKINPYERVSLIKMIQMFVKSNLVEEVLEAILSEEAFLEFKKYKV